jgi:transcription elongation GreA/GreB family factor
MIPKIKIHQACLDKLQSQMDELKSAIAKVQESIINEDNSTAGNKFETARAMGQEELDRINRQMSICIKEFNILNQINLDRECNSIQLGAVVKTSKKTMYMCVALGKIEIDGESIFAISFVSPVGQMLLGKEVGEELVFGGKKEKITAVY